MPDLDEEITVGDVIAEYLKEHNLDGLYNCEYECSCEDVYCCIHPHVFADCHVAYKGWHKVGDEDDYEGIGMYGAVGDVCSPRTQPGVPRVERTNED